MPFGVMCSTREEAGFETLCEIITLHSQLQRSHLLWTLYKTSWHHWLYFHESVLECLILSLFCVLRSFGISSQNPGQSPIFFLMGILWARTSCSLTWLSRAFIVLAGYGFNEASRSFRNFLNDFVLTFYHCLCWAWIDCLYWNLLAQYQF